MQQYLILNVEPIYAVVEIDGKYITMKDGHTQLLLDVGHHVLIASSLQYSPKKIEFNINQSQPALLNIFLEKQSGTIAITTIPSGASVFSDGVKVGTTPFISSELQVGEYTFVIKKEHHEDYILRANVFECRNSQYNIKLQNIDPHVIIKCETSGCFFELHDQFGKVIKTSEEYDGYLFEGQYRLFVKKDEYEMVCVDYKFNNKKEYSYVIPALKLLDGSINIDVLPYGSKVFVDDVERGVTPIMINNLHRGLHKVMIQGALNGILYKDVIVKGGSCTQVNDPIPFAILEDYSDCKIGDFFYSDGTYSHDLNNDKILVGRVFSLHTTEEEKKHGWTHGQIVAVRDAKGKFQWWNKIVVPFPNIRFSKCVHSLKSKRNSRSDALKDRNGYLFTSNMAGHDCPAFDACIRFIPQKRMFERQKNANKQSVLPIGKTSGWYLPSIAQWADIVENLGEFSLEYAIINTFYTWKGIAQLKKKIGIGSNTYWSSTAYNLNNLSYACNIGYKSVEFLSRYYANKAKVRPVAAF